VTEGCRLEGHSKLRALVHQVAASSSVFNQESPVPLERRTPTTLVLVFENNNGLTTGVALANHSDSAQNIGVTLRDGTGAPLPSMPITFPPREYKFVAQ